MNKELEFLQELFTSEGASINILVFLVQLLVTTILSFIVGYFYIRFGNALSNRTALAKTFVLISLTTMLIISIVKSSLALSLGLVGALSIVRFRTAIKEPEELAYFFMVIAIGLGIGAGQFIVTALGTLGLCSIIFLMGLAKNKTITQNFTVQLEQATKSDIESILNTLEAYSTQLTLHRLDDHPQQTSLSFSVSFSDIHKLLSTKEDLQKKYPTISFSFLELK